MVNTGVPFMLHDRTGSLSGSSFNDVHDRISLHVRCTHRDPDGTSRYGVYDVRVSFDIPVATFDYGAGGTLGNITTFGSGNSLRTQAIDAFLVEVGGPRHRRFTAPDGHKYSWSWRTSDDRELEWSCVNASGQNVAWYAISSESGRFFGVEESYSYLVVDLLATLMIMRHIVAQNM